MLKRIKSICSFTRRARNGTIQMPQQQPASASSTEGKLYDSISLLTLDRFIKCYVDGDLHQLKVNPDDLIAGTKLISTWTGIHEAFMDGMRDKEGLYKIRLLGKINHLEFTYRHIHLCVQYLSIAHDQEIITLLQRVVSVGMFNPEDMKSYMNDLQVVLNRAQGLLAVIEEKKAELAIIQKQETPGEKPTRKQFDQLITQVSIFAKFHIDKRVITVSEFIEYYTSRRESFEALEEQHNKR